MRGATNAGASGGGGEMLKIKVFDVEPLMSARAPGGVTDYAEVTLKIKPSTTAIVMHPSAFGSDGPIQNQEASKCTYKNLDGWSSGGNSVTWNFECIDYTNNSIILKIGIDAGTFGNYMYFGLIDS